MDSATIASLVNYQYQTAFQAGGQAAGVAQALGSAQSLAAQASSFLPAASGPAALLELSPQALQASATYALASQTGQGTADVLSLLQQATASSSSTVGGLLPNSGSSPLDPGTQVAIASYQLLQAQQSGQDNYYVRSLINGTNGSTALLNTLI
jgi:hypothetical protein